MGALKTLIDSKGIKAEHLVIASHRVEAGGSEARIILVKRAEKRRTKNEKSYADLGLNKPKSNRGLSHNQVLAAVSDKPVSAKVRSKVLRAVNAVLATKKQPAVDMKALFEGVAAKPGKKAKAEAKPGEKKK